MPLAPYDCFIIQAYTEFSAAFDFAHHLGFLSQTYCDPLHIFLYQFPHIV